MKTSNFRLTKGLSLTWDRTQEEVTDEQLLQTIPNISNQEQSQESEQRQIIKRNAPRQKSSNTIKKTKDKPLKSNKVLTKNKDQQVVDKQTLIFSVTAPIDSVSAVKLKCSLFLYLKQPQNRINYI